MGLVGPSLLRYEWKYDLYLHAKPGSVVDTFTLWKILINFYIWIQHKLPPTLSFLSNNLESSFCVFGLFFYKWFRRCFLKWNGQKWFSILGLANKLGGLYLAWNLVCARDIPPVVFTWGTVKESCSATLLTILQVFVPWSFRSSVSACSRGWCFEHSGWAVSLCFAQLAALLWSSPLGSTVCLYFSFQGFALLAQLLAVAEKMYLDIN